MRIQHAWRVTWFEHCALRERLFDDLESASCFADGMSAPVDRESLLQEFLDQIWLPEQLAGARSRHTVRRYGWRLNGTLVPKIGDERVGGLKTATFAAYLDYARERWPFDFSHQLGWVRSICFSITTHGLSPVPAPAPPGRDVQEATRAEQSS